MTLKVLREVFLERRRQDKKWGEQNHQDGSHSMLMPTANMARANADRAAKEGRLTWAHILTEEFYEAVAEEDQVKLRTELIQVAAVAVAWVECMDRLQARQTAKQGFPGTPSLGSFEGNAHG